MGADLVASSSRWAASIYCCHQNSTRCHHPKWELETQAHLCSVVLSQLLSGPVWRNGAPWWNRWLDAMRPWLPMRLPRFQMPVARPNMVSIQQTNIVCCGTCYHFNSNHFMWVPRFRANGSLHCAGFALPCHRAPFCVFSFHAVAGILATSTSPTQSFSDRWLYTCRML